MSADEHLGAGASDGVAVPAAEPPAGTGGPVPGELDAQRGAPSREAADGGADGAVDTVLSRPYRALTFGIVSVVLLIAFEATAVGTAMPAAAAELNGVSAYAFAFSAFFTTSLLGMVVSGQWCDRRGPLPALSAGIAAFAGGLLLSGTAAAMWIFVLGRAVQGIGGGLVIVSLYVTVSRAYPERLRPPVMASFAAAWVVPSAVGPLIAGAVTEHLGWRWVFASMPVLVLLPLVVMLPALRRAASGPPPGAERYGPVDRRRIRMAVAVAAGAGLLQYGAQALDLAALPVAVAGAVLLVPAVLTIMPRGTYRAARGLPAVVLLRGLATGAYIVTESFIPLMLVTQRGLSVTLAGLTLAAGGASWALGSFIQSRPGLGPHRARLAQAGMALVTLSIVYVPVVLVDSVPVWTLAAGMAVGCFGMGLVVSSTSVLLLELSAPEETGKNSSSLQMSDSLSNVLVLALTGAAFAALGGGSAGSAPSHAAGAHAGSAAGQPLAFVAVYAVAAAVAATGVLAAGRLRVRG